MIFYLLTFSFMLIYTISYGMRKNQDEGSLLLRGKLWSLLFVSRTTDRWHLQAV